MPAAVSTVSASVSTATPSRAPSAPSGQGDSQSFKGELDRAQNQGSSAQAQDSSAKVDDGDSQAAGPDPATNTDSNEATTQTKVAGKIGNTAKIAGKSRIRLANKSDPELVKSRTATDPSKTDPEGDSADTGNNPEQHTTPDDRKSKKKTPTPNDSVDLAGSMPTPPIQPVASNVLETQAATGDKKPEGNVDDKPAASHVQDSTEASNSARVDEIPAADASLHSPALLGSQPVKSSRGRSANATKDNGDPDNASAPKLAAAIQAIATSPDASNPNAQTPIDLVNSDPTTPIAKADPDSLGDASLSGVAQNVPVNQQTFTTAINSTSNPAPASPEAQFADANHSKIVSGITGKLLPDGGSMQLTLDPANLGPMQVRVEMKDGVMSASFETSNDQASKLLTHSLGDLKSALEAQGVTVEKLHVSQSSKDQSPSGDSRQRSSDANQNTASQQEQQRKDMVRRMWRKLMKGQDPLDLVA